jgi:membrane protein implicated in regulation of membrane protease activity
MAGRLAAATPSREKGWTVHNLIFLLPVLGLVVFWIWPPLIAAPIYAVVLLGSAAAYVAIIRVMRRPAMMGPRALEHEPGVVVAVLPHGEAEVRVRGEIWHAVSDDPLHVEDRVEVLAGEHGLVLRVGLWRPRRESPSSPPDRSQDGD